MDGIAMKEIKTEAELKEALDFCWGILGQVSEANYEMYGYPAWRARLADGRQPLVYAEKEGRIVSAVLGRAENKDSLIIGYVACREECRRQGITRALLSYFEELAKEKGFRYVTLGSEEDAFYERCGYKQIFRTHGQNIYQKRF